MSWVQRSLAVLQLFGCEARTHLPDCWLLRLCGAWDSNTLWVKICGVWERRLLGWEGKAKTTPSACRNWRNYYQLEEKSKPFALGDFAEFPLTACFLLGLGHRSGWINWEPFTQMCFPSPDISPKPSSDDSCSITWRSHHPEGDEIVAYWPQLHHRPGPVWIQIIYLTGYHVEPRLSQESSIL